MKISPVATNFIKTSSPQKALFKKGLGRTKNSTVLMSTTAASAIAAATLVKPATKDITVEDIKQKFIERNYKKSGDGSLYRKVSPKEKSQIDAKYGSFADAYRYILLKPVTKDDLTEFKEFLDIDKKAGQKMFNENFDQLYLSYSILKRSGAYKNFIETSKKDKNYFELFSNLINANLDENAMKVFTSYKTDSTSSLNFELREKSRNRKHKIPDYIQRKLDGISSYIDTQKISNPVKLYRGEGYQVLNGMKMPNGKTLDLGKMMLDASLSNNKSKINKIKELVADNEISTTQTGFLSTTINKNVSDRFARDQVVWEFETAPDTKGIFIEGLNMFGIYSDEEEVLLQKNSKITLTDIDFNQNNGVWYVKAKVSN